MEQYKLEKYLVYIFTLVSAGSLITCICNGIAWSHWEDVMDKCPYSAWNRNHENCGCVLFGKKFDSGFRGGAISNCYYVTFAPLALAIFVAVLAGYHIIRVFINNKGNPKPNVSVERRFGEVVVTAVPQDAEDGGSHRVWLGLCGFTTFLAIYTLCYTITLMNGYYKTCNQYRIEVSNDLKAFGNQQAVILGRLSCSAIYDFMDYLFPNYDIYNRGTFINTAITLGLSMQTALVSACLMIIASFIYFKIARINRI